MSGRDRHIYPGNNTPKGFFSYYDYILKQSEADTIVVIKGGPGVGKSTFMRITGEEMLKDGHDVDFMHCSSDNDSIDGIVIRDMNIALIDGTAPHIVDPKNPGAVDYIVHLGDFWKEEGIRENRIELIKANEKVGHIFDEAYNYFAAAGKMYDNMKIIFERAIKMEELYKTSAGIVNRELAHKEISSKKGEIKKYFASALTPGGIINYVENLINGFERIYIISAPVGTSAEKMLEIIMDSAVYRGYDAEAYYCPMVPDKKIEHLLIPKLSLAFVTSNKFHNIEADTEYKIDFNDFIDSEKIQGYEHILADSLSRMESLLDKGIECLKEAKKEHDYLETNYVSNMDFEAVEKCRLDLAAKLKSKKSTGANK